MTRTLRCCMATLLGVAAASAAAAPGAAQPTPPPAVLYVAPLGGDATVMSYVPVRNTPSDEADLANWRGLKRPMRVFVDGAERGMATPLGFSIDDNTMCGGDLRVRLKTAHGPTLAHDALLASFDLNPGQRFVRRDLDAAQQHALLQALGNDPSLRKRLPAAALKALLANIATPPADAARTLTVIADTTRPGHEIAVVTASAYGPAAPATAEDAPSAKLATLLAVLERGDAGWRLRKSIADYGCDDCDERHDDYAVLQFADMDADGTVDFLIQHSGYETHGFWLLRAVDGAWKLEDLVGGC